MDNNALHFFKAANLHPLYFFTLATILGITWQAQGAHWLGILGLLVAFLFFATKQVFLLSNKLFLAITMGGFFCLGALRFMQQEQHFLKMHQALDYQKVHLLFKIVDLEESFQKQGSNLLLIKIISAVVAGKNVSLEGNRYFHLEIPSGNAFEVGDIIATNEIRFTTPHHENFRTYLIKEGLLGYGHLTETSKLIRWYHPPYSLFRYISKIRNKTILLLSKKLSPRTFTLFSSVFWGKHAINKNEINDIRDQFRPWGGLHYLARAGLHLTSILFILSSITVIIPLPFTLRILLSVLLIMFYAIFSWSSIAFVRAISMFYLVATCLLYNLQIHHLYLLCLTALCILLINPHQLLCLDFQLSFSITGIIYWLTLMRRTDQNS